MKPMKRNPVTKDWKRGASFAALHPICRPSGRVLSARWQHLCGSVAVTLVSSLPSSPILGSLRSTFVPALNTATFRSCRPSAYTRQ